MIMIIIVINAFLASAASTRELQESILPHYIQKIKSVTENETRWLALSEAPKPVAEL